MKYSIVLSLLLVLTGCETAFNVTYTLLAAREQSLEESLKNERGYAVSDCYGEFIGKKYAREFWKENNLPRGTTNYVCKDYKAYLPNKVTDCQGNNVIQKYGSISNFAKKYKLKGLSGNYSFICKNNQVTIIDIF